MKGKTMQTKTPILPILFGFLVMGFVDVVGIATSYVKSDFGLSDTLANLLPMMVFLWFAIFSIPTGLLMARIGRRNTVVLSLAVTLVAMCIPLLFYQFTSVLLAFALLGIGNTMLQVSLNPMVAAVVSSDKTASVLTLGQFLKAISSFLGPLIAGACASFAGDWKGIFLVYALTTLLSAIWLLTGVHEQKIETEIKTTFGTACALFQDAYIRLLFLGILVVVGIDVGLNTTIPKLLMEKLDLPLAEAGLGSSLYFSARTIGTFIGAFLLARIASHRFLLYSMLLAILAFVGMLLADSLWLLSAMIIIVGLACANVFSILFAAALGHLPVRSNEISALMVMGIAGAALILPLMGIVADSCGQVAALALLLIGLVYLTYVSGRLKKSNPL